MRSSILKLFAGLLFFVLSSTFISWAEGSLLGMIALAANLMFVPIWAFLVMLSRKPDKRTHKVKGAIYLSFTLFLTLLLAIYIYGEHRIVLGLVVVFLIWFGYLSLLHLSTGGSLSRVKRFWAFQLVNALVLAFKAEQTLETLIYLSPALIGGI
ncbi:hypothetical protein [Thermococcus sp. Bubb.Bath]|uniref:hypothetical protein n=1 Tax=Thermococcus sp. Bubb.Bath TaxID=1638242 RepID=UPI00143B0194|nr:hypothetical protein [Thermococcus sp. Bubb.Bath]NJF25578.1 hypothetical protein [Thermococcus sp. Bubb.Bath]